MLELRRVQKVKHLLIELPENSSFVSKIFPGGQTRGHEVPQTLRIYQIREIGYKVIFVVFYIYDVWHCSDTSMMVLGFSELRKCVILFIPKFFISHSLL